MRALVLLGCATVLLSACGGSDQAAENTDSITANLTADVPPAGDTTAIDAATGADANMAAEAEVPANEADSNAADNEASTNSD